MNQQTRTGLAPKSWGAVAVWLVVLAVVISRPADSVALVFTTVRGTGQWLAYTAFADCGEPPPLDWMTAKECPPPPAAGDNTTDNTAPTPQVDGGDGQAAAAVVDGDDVRQALDAGTERVKALHVWAVEAQDRGASVFALGTTTDTTPRPAIGDHITDTNLNSGPATEPGSEDQP